MNDEQVPNDPDAGDGEVSENFVRLPSIIGGQRGEVIVALQPEGLLVGGDPDGVESYLSRVRQAAGQTLQVAGIDKGSLGRVGGLLTGAASVFGQAAKFVQLHPDSYPAIKQGNLIPGSDGFFRMMTRAADSKFLQQLQWRSAAANPAQLMAVQLLAVQLALETAVAEVAAAVRRVEGKVDQILKLAQATSSGDVLGSHATVSRLADYLDQHGTLPDTLWESAAALGPTLATTVEQLRDHVERSLSAFDPDDPVQDRAGVLAGAVNDGMLGEALNLLVVAEESLYKWQRLVLARVQATEPDQLPTVIEDSRQLLAHQLAADGALYRHAASIVASFGSAKTIQGLAVVSVRNLITYRDQLRRDFDDFARSRRHRIQSWELAGPPSIRDAAGGTVEVAKDAAGQALAAAGQGLIKIGGRLTEERPDQPAGITDRPAEPRDHPG